MKEIKCSNCDNWVNGNLEACSNCDVPFNLRDKLEKEERKKTELEPMNMPLLEIYEDDSPPLKVVKHIIRFHQLIFFSIVSFIAWIVAWAAA